MDLNRQVENGMFFYLATNDVNYFDPNDFYIVQMIMADNKVRLDFYHMPAKKKIYEQVVAEDDDDGSYEPVRVKKVKNWTEMVTNSEDDTMPQELWFLEVTGLPYIKDGKTYFFDVDSSQSTPLKEWFDSFKNDDIFSAVTASADDLPF
jgi:hypothetical protein